MDETAIGLTAKSIIVLGILLVAYDDDVVLPSGRPACKNQRPDKSDPQDDFQRQGDALTARLIPPVVWYVCWPPLRHAPAVSDVLHKGCLIYFIVVFSCSSSGHSSIRSTTFPASTKPCATVR